jgi:TRAP-type C4-dicarboxylate transport system permease small subunit
METMDGFLETKKRPAARVVVRMLIAAACGAALGAGFMWTLRRLHVSAKSLGWPEFLAYWLGLSFLGLGLALIALSFNRRDMAKKLEGEDAKLPATDEEVHVYRMQAVSLVLAGVMILLPVLSTGSLMKTPLLAGVVFGVIVGLFVWQSAVNVMVWRRSDEFQRAQLTLVCAITFWIGQGALFLWAAAERLRLAPALSSWEIVLLLMTLYVLASGWMGIKNRPR